MTAHVLMVGGFLGAGKTTALLRAAEHLTRCGRRVGLIMNDQSCGLVDTALVRSREFATEEIAGGCFCCRFNSLIEAADRLDRDASPDVLLAEPVGSCTDLVATVALPLRRLYGVRYVVAPLTVLVDPNRALRVLGVEPGRSFSEDVEYVYLKQLEEADVIAINKVDAVNGSRVSLLRSVLEARFPSARVLEMSARSGGGVESWIEALLESPAQGRVLSIDYDTYADGEALLGWLNCTASLDGPAIDADELLVSIAGRIHRELTAESREIAHLKLTLASGEGRGIAVVNAVSVEAPPELSFALEERVTAAELTLNVRAEADPERIAALVGGALQAEAAARGTSVVVQNLERFRPGRPVPTHRMEEPPGS